MYVWKENWMKISFILVCHFCWYKWKFKIICKRWTEADKNVLCLDYIFEKYSCVSISFCRRTFRYILMVRQQSIRRIFSFICKLICRSNKRIYHKNITQRRKVPITPKKLLNCFRIQLHRSLYNWGTLKSITNSFP